jgi:hypothetical protein
VKSPAAGGVDDDARQAVFGADPARGVRHGRPVDVADDDLGTPDGR